MNYYLAVKRNELLTYGSAEHYTEGEKKSQKVLCCLIQLCGILEMKMDGSKEAEESQESDYKTEIL